MEGLTKFEMLSVLFPDLFKGFKLQVDVDGSEIVFAEG
jgi:hypothetical protein